MPTESVSTIGEQREVPDDLYVAAPVKKGKFKRISLLLLLLMLSLLYARILNHHITAVR